MIHKKSGGCYPLINNLLLLNYNTLLDYVDDNLNNKEQSDNVCWNCNLLCFSTACLDDDIRKDTEHDTIRDGVSTYHHEDT